MITAVPEMVIAMELESADVTLLHPEPLIVSVDELHQVQPDVDIATDLEPPAAAELRPEQQIAADDESTAVISDVSELQPELQPETAIEAESDTVIQATSLNRSFTDLIPLPKSVRTSRSKRAVAHAKVITTSPYKRKLEEAVVEKNRKMNVQKRRLEKSFHVSAPLKAHEDSSVSQNLINKNCKGKKSRHKKSQVEDKGSNEGSVESQARKGGKGTNGKKAQSTTAKSKRPVDDPTCLYCNGLYSESRRGEKWAQCQGSCAKWCHDSCAGLIKTDMHFVCEICQN